jgi:hypothetical protein
MLTDQSVGHPVGRMDNLVCTGCGTTYYSAAAASMVDRGERCDCGAPLRLIGEEDQAGVRVGAEERRSKDDEEPASRRRFSRD